MSEFIGAMVADVPVVGDVRAGVVYDSGTKTGNLALPPAGKVHQGFWYGTTGTEVEGALVLPDPSDVRAGVPYGDPTL